MPRIATDERETRDIAEADSQVKAGLHTEKIVPITINRDLDQPWDGW